MPSQTEQEMHDSGQLLYMLRLEVDEIWGATYTPTQTLRIDPAQLPAVKRRLIVRSAFAAIEATAYTLKRLAIVGAMVLRLQNKETLTEEEKVLCREERYELGGNGEVETKKAKLTFVPNLRFSFKAFAKAWDIVFVLDTNAPKWKQLVNSVAVRDRLMHPKRLADLEVTDTEVREALRGFIWIEENWA